MSKAKGYIGARMTAAIVALSAAMIVVVLALLYLSQPILPEVEMRVDPVNRGFVKVGYAKGLNLSEQQVMQVASVFNMSGVASNDGSEWKVNDRDRSLMLTKNGSIAFRNNGFVCNGSTARNRSDFVDPLGISNGLIERLVERGAFPDYTWSIISIS